MQFHTLEFTREFPVRASEFHAEFDIVFGEGISRTGEIVDLGVELGIIQKSGSWFSYNETKLAQGREAVKKLMQDNVELAEEIEAKIREALANVQD